MMEKTLRDTCLEYVENNPGVSTAELTAEIRKYREVRTDSVSMTLTRLKMDGIIDRPIIDGVVRNYHRGPGTRFGVDPKIYRFYQLQAQVRANHG